MCCVVRVVVLALDREHGNVVLVDERSGNLILRGQRIRRAEDDVGAAALSVRFRFAVSVVTCRHAEIR